ncbi:zinc fingers and homeoboxes protein 1-like isoform X3 [Pseudoliparis swirei]|uniref:zinc fingers and homeoboxes protein 1-like isoform X3 n=1 Tax=Pseudoliparis swirei TaxID=2059687 RepID=UPI0024BECE0B|nr:zinc fingers and homeoboxes protein 1-like isoform X3 [Pseudoliparis swirei]
MASRRKTTTPCMVPPREAVDSDQEMEDVGDAPEPDDGGAAAIFPEPPEEAGEDSGPGSTPDLYLDANMAEGGYECKYCSFKTAELKLFTLHVDQEHPDVVTNTSYVCMECDYHTKSYDTLLAHNARLHPGAGAFRRTMVRRSHETVFRQSVKQEDEAASRRIALSQTPIMRSRGRPELNKFAGLHKMAAADVIKVESEEDEEPPAPSPAPAFAAAPRLVPVSAPVQVHAVPQSIVVNGSNLLQIKGGGVLPPGTLAQVLSALQNQQNCSQTQLLIPISSIPTYNTAMDNNVLLVSAYNRFPYPSLSEVLGLSSQTKFSEEQIKVWFSAQRLKHGVSWTPEEVEEARRKKFNGMVQAVSQTITVIPANMAAGGLQSIFHTCQIVGQPGLVLTQVSGGGSAVPVAAPITLTVAGVPGNRPKAAEPSATESKTETLSAGAVRGPDAAAAPSSSKPKKSKEQLAELKASYGRRQFATEAEISRLMQVTKLSKRAIKKWFSDTRYNQRNAKDHHGVPLGEAPPTKLRGARSGLDDDSGGASTIVVIDSSDDASDCSPPAARDPRVKFRHAFPDFTPQKFKEKTAEQLLVLEASYQGCSTPPDEELGRLRGATKLTRRELDAWFTERRKTPSKEEEEEDEEDEDESRSTPPSGRKSLKKTTEQLHFLKKAFVRSQWPTAAEYDVMAADSRLPRSYIVNWFGDTRYACKNSNLKWFYLYQSGKVDEALNGEVKTQKKSRKRFRGWSRRTRRPYPCKRSSPQGGATPIKLGEMSMRVSVSQLAARDPPTAAGSADGDQAPDRDPALSLGDGALGPAAAETY